jgi:hypothetical protein
VKAKHDTTYGAWRVSTKDGLGRLLVHRDATVPTVNLDCVATAPAELRPLQVGHFERRGGGKRDAADLRKALDDIFAADLARPNAAPERGRQRVGAGPDGSDVVPGEVTRPEAGYAGPSWHDPEEWET